MLFPYIYVPHQMEKMQEFINFIFFEVWCQAPTAGPFGLHLFDANPELREVMAAFYYSDAKGADFFYGHIEGIYGQFAELSPADILRFQCWYQGNNDLEKVCANDAGVQLVRYADMAMTHPELSKHLATFFKGLYSPSLLGLAALKSKIGDIDEHYHAFMSTNKAGQCPFCGLNDLLGEYHSKREAYDHYLPKAIYPFNSINFRNLVPACHHCNSSYKTSNDIALTPKDPCGQQARRKLFYPFSTEPHQISLQVTLQHADYDNLKPENIDLNFGPAELGEQIATWRDVYGIEERYRAKLCSADAKDWLVQVLDEWRWYEKSGGTDGRKPEVYLRAVARHTDNSFYTNANFLKYGFLLACKNVGIFDEIESQDR